MAKRKGLLQRPRTEPDKPARVTSNWRDRLASMSKEEADAFRKADSARTKAYRDRKKAIARGEAPPEPVAPVVRPGDLVEVPLDEERPIRSFKAGERVVVRTLTRSIVYEIRDHFGAGAGTVVIERTAKSRSFTAKVRVTDAHGRFDDEVTKDVAFTSEGSRSTVISSNTMVSAVMREAGA